MGGKKYPKKDGGKESQGGGSAPNQPRRNPNQQQQDNRPQQQGTGNQQRGQQNIQQGPGNQQRSGGQQGPNNQQRSNEPRRQNPPSDHFAQMSLSAGQQQRGGQQQRQQNAPAQQSQGAWSQSKPGQSEQQAQRQQQAPRRQPDQPTQGRRREDSQSSSASSQTPSQKSVIKPAQSRSVPTNMPHLMCEHKGFGTRGRKLIGLETNYLKLILNKMADYAYHYDIQIEPDKPKKYMNKIFQQFAVRNFRDIGIAFDGAKNAYSPVKLNLENVEREVDFVHLQTRASRKYIVAIKETADMQVELKSLKEYNRTRQFDAPKRALQVLEIILKGAFHQDHLSNGVTTTRSFYMAPQGRREYLGDFFELWYGLFQSTVLGGQPYLNVDISHKAFPKRYQSLKFLMDDIVREKGDEYAIEDMKKHLAGMDVIYVTPGNAGDKRIYKFMGIVGDPSKVKFKDQNNREITVAQYFRERNFPINHPTLPCIKLGNSIKNITVPMEHCELPDSQALNKKCTEIQTRNIIRFAATSTDVRKDKIMGILNTIKHNQSRIMQNFGLSLDANFVKVDARCLEAPDIQYANRPVKVVNGVWRGEGMQFLEPQVANRWAILNANNRTKRNELMDFAQMLYKTSRPTSLQLAEKPYYIQDVDSRNSRAIENEMEAAKKKGIDILFCVIPDSGPTYASIKQLAETQVGVLTQCIKGGTIFRKRNDGSTISNILLKVNAKLNGTNHRLNDSTILKDRCMLIGADVTHASPDQREIPSVVGVAASHDKNAFCYNVAWRLQGLRIEIIEDFGAIVKEHLQFYFKKNNYLPNKILYYRDGVSEGQFQQVMGTECQQMRAEIKQMYKQPNWEPKLTIIVVQKRHHTRFFPGKTDIGKNDRRNNNVPAGTIVDKEIVHPNENHFYLVSHQSIQGVAKPTKYCILLDEGDHSIDDLQTLSYNLCHLFSRCNRSVSYPAPTYYAHLVAYRGRVYIENKRINMNNLKREWETRTVQDNIIRGHPMFFV